MKTQAELEKEIEFWENEITNQLGAIAQLIKIALEKRENDDERAQSRTETKQR